MKSLRSFLCLWILEQYRKEYCQECNIIWTMLQQSYTTLFLLVLLYLGIFQAFQKETTFHLQRNTELVQAKRQTDITDIMLDMYCFFEHEGSLANPLHKSEKKYDSNSKKNSAESFYTNQHYISKMVQLPKIYYCLEVARKKINTSK